MRFIDTMSDFKKMRIYVFYSLSSVTIFSPSYLQILKQRYFAVLQFEKFSLEQSSKQGLCRHNSDTISVAERN